MEITYRTNGVNTTQSLTEWYFGKKFVKYNTKAAISMAKSSKKNSFRFWQDGTGYLTIEIH